MLIFIYSRKSRYTEKGKSIENQIEMCKEYIYRNIQGVNPEDIVIVIYEDEDFSGKDTNRPQFQKMIDDIKKKKPDYVVCYMLDRISRSVNDFSTLVDYLFSMKSNFICVKEQFDTSTPSGRAMMYMTSVFAQLERETIAQRIRDNMMMLARTGIWLGGTCPTGFTSERKANVLIDGKIKEYSYLKENEDIETVKIIFDKFLELGSTRYVAQYLALKDIKTVNGIVFFQRAIEVILQNPVYCTADEDSFRYFKQKGSEVYFDQKDFHKGLGIMPFNRRNVRLKHINNSVDKWIIALGKHKGIVSGKDWVEIQNIFSKRKSMPHTYSNNALVSCLIRCEKCGEHMFIRSNSRRNKKMNFSYVCRKKRQARTKNV